MTASPETPTGARTLYARHRPKRFEDLIGQQSGTVLRNAVRAGNVGHAWLLSGPRGTGKTSSARILAKALNCSEPIDGEPCNNCATCTQIDAGTDFSVTEVDAASNNGVDHIRELLKRASLSSGANWKVIILDEVHQLSAAAGNVLLKSLEEPPPGVVFILATTDPQRVLPTVRSRCRTLQYRLVSSDVLGDHLSKVITEEALTVDAAGIAEAVRQGRGSVRDALSALEVIACGGAVNADDAGELVEALAVADVGAALAAIARAAMEGADPRQLAENAVAVLRDVFLAQLGSPDLALASTEPYPNAIAAGPKVVVAAIETLGDALTSMRAGHDPRVTLDIGAARHCRRHAA